MIDDSMVLTVLRSVKLVVDSRKVVLVSANSWVIVQQRRSRADSGGVWVMRSSSTLAMDLAVVIAVFSLSETTRQAAAQCEAWGGLQNGTNALVASSAVFNGELVVGGEFSTAGSTAVNNVASWDGVRWHPLGAGTDLSVHAMTVYNNELVAAGFFTTAGGQPASHIASWNGKVWRPLGLGTNNYVAALTVYKGRLIAGGFFTTAGGIAVDGIAQWNGTSWTNLGPGNFVHDVNCLIVYHNELIAGNSADFSGSLSLARWDGSAWHGLQFPNSSFGAVSLAVYDDKLVAGGYLLGGSQSVPLEAWNGSFWQPLGNGMTNNTSDNAIVTALGVYNGDLIAGGVFSAADGTPVDAIARWNRVLWQPIASGVRGANPPDVASLAEFNRDLIAGGFFTSAGGVEAHNIARWRDCNLCLEDVNSDRQVNIDDLLSVINAWGACPPQPLWCSADIAPAPTGNGIVDFDDLLAVVHDWPPFGCCDNRGDVNHDGHIDLDDVLTALNQWGPCPPPPPPVCNQDITRSGAVDIDDLLAVINAWGPCP